MNEITERNIECPLCYEVYLTNANSLKSPRILINCGHSYCFECLKSMFKDSEIKCPVCLKITKVNTPEELKINYSLISILDEHLNNRSEFMTKQNELQKSFDEISQNIKKLYDEKRDELIIYQEKAMKHVYAITSLVIEGSSIFEKMKKTKINIKKEVLDDVSMKLENYLNEKRNKLSIYTNQLKIIEDSFLKLDQTFDKINNEKNLKIDKLFDIQTVILRINEVNKLDRQLLEKEIEGHNFLIGIEKVLWKQLSDVGEKATVLDILQAINNQIENTIFRIGVVGMSVLSFNKEHYKFYYKGMGKSSIINRLRGIDDMKLGAAPTGINESTLTIGKYVWDQHPEVNFIDFPGFSCYSSANEYADKWLNKHICDMYILLRRDRIDFRDVDIAKYICEKLEKPFVTVRSFADINCEKIFEDAKNLGKNVSDEEALQQIRNSEKININMYKDKFNESFKQSDFIPYIISCKSGDQMKFEMEDFIDYLISKAPTALSGKLAESCFIAGKKQVRQKRIALEKRIKILATASGATDFIPFAGVAADIGIIIGEVFYYRECFGLKNSDLEELAKVLKINADETRKISKILGLDSKYLNIKNLVLTTLSGLGIAFGAVITKTIFGAAGFGLGLLSFGIGSVVVGAITAPISYMLTEKVLKKILCQMEYDAMRMIDLLKKSKEEDDDEVEEAPIFGVVGWTNSKTCMLCNENFKLFRRQHHCRKCGYAVCDDCSNNTCIIPTISKTEPYRVCNECFNIK